MVEKSEDEMYDEWLGWNEFDVMETFNKDGFVKKKIRSGGNEKRNRVNKQNKECEKCID